MEMFHKKTPFEKEWDRLEKKESVFLKGRQEKKDTLLNQKLAEKVPEKLQHTLDAAFAKAFSMIFEKGTAIIEKTYRKEELEKTCQVNQYADKIRQNRNSLRAFSRMAGVVEAKNLVLSGVSGIGLGALGIGLPDIPLFTGLILKNVYETALSYGFEYDSEEERYFVLLLIQGAVSYGDKMNQINGKVNEYIRTVQLPENYSREKEIHKTARLLSKELLYMKFLQGIPIVGVVGGVYDIVYMKRVSSYANLKYWRRFLSAKNEIEGK